MIQEKLGFLIIIIPLFTKLPWPRVSEGTFQSLSQAASGPPVYYTWWGLHNVPFIAERQAGKV